VEYARNSSPGRLYPSPERPKDVGNQPIKKLLDNRLRDIRKVQRTRDIVAIRDNQT
jgi:hypothetical protein